MTRDDDLNDRLEELEARLGPSTGTVHGGPLTAMEKAQLGDDAGAWDENPLRRKLIRALGREATRR